MAHWYFFAISALTAAVYLAHYLNLNAIARELSSSNQEQWEAYRVLKLCRANIQYHCEWLNSSMKTPLELFRAARIVPFKSSGDASKHIYCG